MTFPIVLNLVASREGLGKCFKVVLLAECNTLLLAHSKVFLDSLQPDVSSPLPLSVALHKASFPAHGMMDQTVKNSSSRFCD
jgi:hypothetical protein